MVACDRMILLVLVADPASRVQGQIGFGKAGCTSHSSSARCIHRHHDNDTTDRPRFPPVPGHKVRHQVSGYCRSLRGWGRVDACYTSDTTVTPKRRSHPQLWLPNNHLVINVRQ